MANFPSRLAIIPSQQQPIPSPTKATSSIRATLRSAPSPSINRRPTISRRPSPRSPATPPAPPLPLSLSAHQHSLRKNSAPQPNLRPHRQYLLPSGHLAGHVDRNKNPIRLLRHSRAAVSRHSYHLRLRHRRRRQHFHHQRQPKRPHHRPNVLLPVPRGPGNRPVLQPLRPHPGFRQSSRRRAKRRKGRNSRK